jgi:chitin synthase
MQNIAHLCTRTKSKTWGKDGWKKVSLLDLFVTLDRAKRVQVVVCIVADGRMKINARTRSVLAALGVYQEGVGKNVVNGKPVVCL